METIRVRFGSILEWMLAAALTVLALAVGSILFRELRTVRAVMPVIAGGAIDYPAPESLPPRAVSVPMLLLGNGREVRIGDRASEVAARLGNAAQVVSESLDGTAVRQRMTRVYRDIEVQFILVFEALDRETEPRVAAIYVR